MDNFTLAQALRRCATECMPDVAATVTLGGDRISDLNAEMEKLHWQLRTLRAAARVAADTLHAIAQEIHQPQSQLEKAILKLEAGMCLSRPA